MTDVDPPAAAPERARPPPIVADEAAAAPPAGESPVVVATPGNDPYRSSHQHVRSLLGKDLTDALLDRIKNGVGWLPASDAATATGKSTRKGAGTVRTSGARPIPSTMLISGRRESMMNPTLGASRRKKAKKQTEDEHYTGQRDTDEFVLAERHTWSEEADALAQLVQEWKAKNKPGLDFKGLLMFFSTLRLTNSKITEINPLTAEMENLKQLSLIGNYISRVAHLPPSLEVLNLYGNRLSTLPDLFNLPSLVHLGVGYNRIVHLRPLPSHESLQTMLPSLLSLDLSYNDLTDLTEAVTLLAALPRLRHLNMVGNSFFLARNYRSYVIDSLPHITVLDDQPVTEDERERSHGARETAPDYSFSLGISIQYARGLREPTDPTPPSPSAGPPGTDDDGAPDRPATASTVDRERAPAKIHTWKSHIEFDLPQHARFKSTPVVLDGEAGEKITYDFSQTLTLTADRDVKNLLADGITIQIFESLFTADAEEPPAAGAAGKRKNAAKTGKESGLKNATRPDASPQPARKDGKKGKGGAAAQAQAQAQAQAEADQAAAEAEQIPDCVIDVGWTVGALAPLLGGQQREVDLRIPIEYTELTDHQKIVTTERRMQQDGPAADDRGFSKYRPYLRGRIWLEGGADEGEK